MRYVVYILLGISLVLIGLSFGLFQNHSGRQSNPSVIVIPVDPTSMQLQNELVNQRATAQAELEQLEVTLSQQQIEFQTRKIDLENQISAARQKLGQLKAQQQTLVARLAQLEAAQASQSITATVELEAARSSYLPRREELQSRLDALQAELATVEAQLGP